MTTIMPKTVAVLDACVLYPPSLRDLLMWLATVEAYEPRMTEDIHAEWIRNVLADNPDVTPTQLDRTRRLMNQVAPNCLVSGHKAHIPTLSLPDAGDRHVLAAAIEAGAAVLVTFNLSDFPAAPLEAYGIEPLHPDVFLSALFDDDSELFLRAVQAHRASLHSLPKDAQGYVQTLRANGLKELALRVEVYADALWPARQRAYAFLPSRAYSPASSLSAGSYRTVTGWPISNSFHCSMLICSSRSRGASPAA